MDNKKITSILAQMEITQKPLSLSQFRSEEDNEYYNVWHIQINDSSMVLKEAKGFELDTYKTFFQKPCAYAPQLFETTHQDGKDYLLMEYISGQNLRRCDRENLILVLDSMIAMQNEWWGREVSNEGGYHYLQSLPGRQNRGNYLNDAQLEAAYSAFLQEYSALPRTLCHDDLLPFNVIRSEGRAVFIDWEYGGILPYPVSLARFIAHGEEKEEAFFYMTEADKAFALDYYYQNFIRHKGISLDAFSRSIGLFLFYEYCEWVFLGNKYGDTSSHRFQNYYQNAKKLASALGF